MRSQIFYTDEYCRIETTVRDFLNAQDAFLSPRTAGSTRAVGDAVQEILAGSFESLLGESCTEYWPSFPRKAMEDFAFRDRDQLYYAIDVKTHRISTSFNMPNLTSVYGLAEFYEDDSKYFVVLLVTYELENTRVLVSNVTFVPIEFLGWDCLRIAALGRGQIQIADSNYVNVVPGYSRKKWMLEFCEAVLKFYPKERAKIGDRIKRFESLRDLWNAKVGGA